MDRIKNLKMIEFSEVIAGIEVPFVALFNTDRITEEKAKEWLEHGYPTYHPFMVWMFKEQYENIMDLED